MRVEYTQNGEQKIEMVRLVISSIGGNNRLAAVNQLETAAKGKRIPDIIGFANGLPLVAFGGLKIHYANRRTCRAFNQFETHKDEIAELFVWQPSLITSDGIVARLGSLADFQRFTPWKVVDEKNKSARLYFDDELPKPGLMACCSLRIYSTISAISSCLNGIPLAKPLKKSRRTINITA